MVEQRLFWEKYRDESDSKFPTYTYRVGMTTSSHSINGMIWKTIQSSLPPEEELKMLQQLYPTYDMIDGMMGFYKREHESTTTYQWWDDALKKYRPYPFDCCSEELFDWERNIDVGYDENYKSNLADFIDFSLFPDSNLKISGSKIAVFQPLSLKNKPTELVNDYICEWSESVKQLLEKKYKIYLIVSKDNLKECEKLYHFLYRLF